MADHNAPQDDDLDQLREQIDELQSTPVEQMIDPLPESLRDRLPTPEPTDAIGSEDGEDAEQHDTE